MTLLFFVISLAMVAFGADLLVRSAAHLSQSLRIRPLTVGLMVLGFGNSLPEATVGFFAHAQGVDDLAVGNIVGSNLLNMGVALGLVAIFWPLKVTSATLRVELPYLLVVHFLLFWVARHGHIYRAEAFTLVAIFLLFMILCFLAAKETADSKEKNIIKSKNLPINILYISLGFLLLIAGGQWMVMQTEKIAVSLGVSQGWVGALVIAWGTSAPEIITSVVAACRRQPGLSVGNILGANVFNAAAILGMLGLVAPLHVPVAYLRWDFPFLLILSGEIWLAVMWRREITRGWGCALLASYFAYVLGKF